jgi:hypothetical protein
VQAVIKTLTCVIVNTLFAGIAFRGGMFVGESNALYRMGHTSADEQFPGLLGMFLLFVSILTIALLTFIATVHEE